MKAGLKTFLDEQSQKYHHSTFILSDPIQIPKQFRHLQDIEITALWTAILSWGNRKAIIKSCQKLVAIMDGAPYDFILNHKESDLQRFISFKYRTFQPTDALYFISFLHWYYTEVSVSLENAFCGDPDYLYPTTFEAIRDFHDLFFSLEFAPERTRKHIATPIRGSSCKRINMFLRWMCRKDDKNIDFGCWNKIKPKQLIIPLDVHVSRAACHLGLLDKPKADWKRAVSLTKKLQKFRPDDPVYYDYVLFGAGQALAKGEVF